MKFSTILFSAGLIVAVAARDATSSSVAPEPTKSVQQKCLEACEPSDVKCQATCVGNPSPSDEQVNETTACSKKCDQGDGSAEKNAAYGVCLRKCAEDHYLPQTDANDGAASTPTSTGSGSRTTDESGNVVNDTDSNNNSSATITPGGGGSGASSLLLSSSFAGIVAVMAAFFSL